MAFHQPLGGTGLVRTETSISALEFHCSFVGTLHGTNFRGRASLPGALPLWAAVVSSDMVGSGRVWSIRKRQCGSKRGQGSVWGWSGLVKEGWWVPGS